MDDQHFNPGDKVMRVDDKSSRRDRGLPHVLPPVYFGVVYCVERTWVGITGRNLIRFVGDGPEFFTPSGFPIGRRAANYRKVEEIKLCVAAVSHAKAPQETVNA